MWSNNVSVEERPETAKRALESAGLDHEVWNLVFMSFAIVFFKPQWSTSPKLFADRSIETRYPHSWYVGWWIFRWKDLHCWWRLGWVPEAINPIRSCSGSFALGHLFLRSFFFWGGHLFDIVWRIFLKDSFFITCPHLGEDLLDLRGVRETVGLLDIKWSDPTAGEQSYNIVISAYADENRISDPPDLNRVCLSCQIRWKVHPNFSANWKGFFSTKSLAVKRILLPVLPHVSNIWDSKSYAGDEWQSSMHPSSSDLDNFIWKMLDQQKPPLWSIPLRIWGSSELFMYGSLLNQLGKH